MSEITREVDAEVGTGSRKEYIIGFVLSLALTFVAWTLVNHHVQTHHLFWTDRAIVITIIGLAITQLIVQLLFFLHVGKESKPRWNLTALSFALTVLLILVLGSLWIMYNLNYHHVHNLPAPSELDKSIIKDEGISQ